MEEDINMIVNERKRTSRVITRRVICAGIGDFLEWKCSNCGSTEKLNIHHHIYPTEICKVIRAIADGDICILCYDCHRKLHSKKNEN